MWHYLRSKLFSHKLITGDMQANTFTWKPSLCQIESCASGFALCNGLLATGHDLTASIALRWAILTTVTGSCLLQLRTLQVAAQRLHLSSQLGRLKRISQRSKIIFDKSFKLCRVAQTLLTNHFIIHASEHGLSDSDQHHQTLTFGSF